MKAYKIFIFLIFCILLLFFTECGVKKMVKKQNDISYQLISATPDIKGGKTTIQIKGTFPEKYFNKKTTISSIPVLKNDVGNKDTLSTINFQGEKADGQGQIVKYKQGAAFTSTQTILYKPEFEQSTLYIHTVLEKNGKEYIFGEREIGTINIKAKRQDINPKLTYKTTTNDKPNYFYSNHNYIPNKPIEKVAVIYFDFNRDDLDWNLPYNKKPENSQLLKELFPFVVQYDSIQVVEIEGWASPEGELKRNMQLSSNRSIRGEKWFADELTKYIRENSKTDSSLSTFNKKINYQLIDNGEDWNGFISALNNSTIKEKNQIINVIQSQSDQGEKEQQIRNMIAIYDEVDAIILPSLRRAKIKVVCLENLKTDEQIAKFAVTTPDSLTNDELLYAASMTDDINTKKQIFEKAIEIYPENFRAYNDLGCIKISEGKTDEAKKLFEKSNSLNPNNDIVFNNLGILSYQNKDYDNAEKFFNASQNAGLDQKNNLLLVKDTILITSVNTSEPLTVPKEEDKIDMAVKMNALLLVGVLNPAFEIKFSKHFSAQISSFATYWPNGFLFTDKPLSLFTGFLEARYYPKEVFKGFYVGLNSGFGLFNMSRTIIPNFWGEPHDGVMHQGWNYMGGLTLGWSFPIKNHWGIEPYMMTGYTYANFDNYFNNMITGVNRTQSAFVYTYGGGIYVYYRF